MRHQRVSSLVLGAIPFASLLGVWWLVWYFSIIPRWLLSSPTETWQTFFKLAQSGQLVKLLATSFTNATVSFTLALFVALLVGTVVGVNSTAKKVFLPFLSFIYPIPSLAWLPLIIMLFGFSRGSVWIIVGLSAFFRMVFPIINGIRSVNQRYLWTAENLGYSKWGKLVKIIYPAALPAIMSGIRVGFGSAWRSLIGAEIIVPLVGGLGSYIAQSQSQFRFDQVFAGVIVISFVSYAIEKLIFERLEERIDATESRIYSRLADLEDKMEGHQQDTNDFFEVVREDIRGLLEIKE